MAAVCRAKLPVASDDMLAQDIALRRFDLPLPRTRALDGRHLRLAMYFGAEQPRALGKSLCHVGRSGMAVVGMEESALQIVDPLDERP